jgi:hypothetical protein
VAKRDIDPRSNLATANSRSSVAVPSRLGRVPSRSVLHHAPGRILENRATESKAAENDRTIGDQNTTDVFYGSAPQGQAEGHRRKEVFETKAGNGPLRKMVNRGQLEHGDAHEQDGPMEGMHSSPPWCDRC